MSEDTYDSPKSTRTDRIEVVTRSERASGDAYDKSEADGTSAQGAGQVASDQLFGLRREIGRQDAINARVRMTDPCVACG